MEALTFFRKPEAGGQKPEREAGLEARSRRPEAGGEKPEAGAGGRSRRPKPEAKEEQSKKSMLFIVKNS